MTKQSIKSIVSVQADNLSIPLSVARIQFVDVINDLDRGAFLLVPGLLIFAAVFLIGAWQLFGQAIWHIDAWRERG